MEDAAVRGERNNAFLDSRTCAVVQSDNRSTDLQREVHQLVNLLGEHFTECATHDGEVLAEHENLATINRSPTGDNTVGVGLILETGGMRAVAGEKVEFVERARIEEVLHALAGNHLALAVLALNRTLGSRGVSLFPALREVVQLLLHHVVGHGETLVRGASGR